MVETYYYGHGDWPSVFSPAADSVYQQPVRERQMINIARQQLAAQERARKDIVKSNIAGAQIIACEMEHQTQALEGAIQGMGRQVTDAIGASADQITGVIEGVGQALCMELSEIRWQLAQQSATLERMLEVLAESRSNETRQLVRQGLRHYLNGEYAEAEERFRKALDFDTTDYQVLMNLAFISLHKNEAEEAFSFFKKALSLPEDLDDASRARNLWATARLFYSQKDFARAQAYAEKAFQHEQAAKAEGLFKLGVYQALAGHEGKAIGSLRNAIDMDPALFGRCAVEPDLNCIKSAVLSRLSLMAQNASEAAQSGMKSAQSKLEELKGRRLSSEYAAPLRAIANKIERLTSRMRLPTYADLLFVKEQVGSILPLANAIASLDEMLLKRNHAYSARSAALSENQARLEHLKKRESDQSDAFKSAKESRESVRKSVRLVGGVLAFLWCIWACYSVWQEANRPNGEKGFAAFMLLATVVWVPLVVMCGLFLGRLFGKWFILDPRPDGSQLNVSIRELENEISPIQRELASCDAQCEQAWHEVRKLLHTVN